MHYTNWEAKYRAGMATARQEEADYRYARNVRIIRAEIVKRQNARIDRLHVDWSDPIE